MSYIEIRNAQISEDLRRKRKENITSVFSRTLSDLGYQGNLLPVFLFLTFTYLFIAVLLSLFGVNQVIGLFISFPLSLLFAVILRLIVKNKQDELFKKQLLQVISLVVASLDNGDNPINAFTKASLSVGDPLQKEFIAALQSMISAEDTLSQALEKVRNKYPSRSFDLVMAALSVDDKVGAKLGAPLRQAQKTLEKEFELAAEANAEISQARSEFYGITSVIGLVAFVLISGSSGQASEAYSSPLGIVVISFLSINYVIGIVRTLKIFQRAKRGY